MEVQNESHRPVGFVPRIFKSSAYLRECLAAFFVYAVLAILFFARGLVAGSGSHYIGRGADPTVMMWMFKWWPYAIAHHLNVFVTNLVWAPVGFNLASMTSIPLLAIVAYPFTRTLGLVSAYNILALMAPTTAALCAFMLCRQITGKFWPSIFGGYLFGFSAYMLGHLLGHLCLVMVFAFPLAVYLVVAHLNEELTNRSFIVLLAFTLVAQFLIDMELFATGVIFGSMTFAAIIYYSPAVERRRYYAEISLIASSLFAATTIVSPYIYYFLAFERLKQPFWPAETFSTDLLNFVIPTPANLLGANQWAKSVSSRFAGNVAEQGGYIALPALVMLALWARRNWRHPVCKALVAVLVAGCVATLGPWLQIGGDAKGALPWLAVVRMPLLEHVLPARLIMIVSLFFAVIAALWLSQADVAPRMKAAAALLTIGMMLPNPSASWVSQVDSPKFFTRGNYLKYLSPSDVVLTLPWGEHGSSMLWQAECGMCFRNVGGWTGEQRFAVRRWPIIDYFLGAFDLEDVDTQFKAFLANTNVSVVLVGDASIDAPRWNSLAQSLNVPRAQVSGVSLYRIPRGLLDHYASMSGVEMESRADLARFNMALRATSRYLASGYDPRQLSVDRLIQLSFLPASWRRENENLVNLYVTEMSNGQFAIGEFGSYAAFRKLIETHRARANAIYYPYPEILWEPHPPAWPLRFLRAALTPPAAGPVDGESIHMLAIDFTREQLDQAATSIASAGEEHLSGR